MFCSAAWAAASMGGHIEGQEVSWRSNAPSFASPSELSAPLVALHADLVDRLLLRVDVHAVVAHVRSAPTGVSYSKHVERARVIDAVVCVWLIGHVVEADDESALARCDGLERVRDVAVADDGTGPLRTAQNTGSC